MGIEMERLLSISTCLDRIITKIGNAAAWVALPLILVTVFDVITRRFFVLGSTRLQEAEWHLHTVLFTLVLGAAYLKDSHVRVDLLRERLSSRNKAWLEVIGCLFFLLPYTVLILFFSFEFVANSFQMGESSASTNGLDYRWLIKSSLIFGFVLVLGAGVSVLLKNIVFLARPVLLKSKKTILEPTLQAEKGR